MTTTQMANLYPTDPYPQVGESLYTPTAAPESESLYDTTATGDRWSGEFYPPFLPVPRGVFDAVTWVSDGSTPMRWLDGMTLRQTNFGLSGQFGIWGEGWCAGPDELTSDKVKERADAVFTEFGPMTAYAFDHNQCGDMTAGSRTEVRDRAVAALTRNEQQAVEVSIADRLLADATTTVTAATVTEAVSKLEVELAKAGIAGAYLHASPKWAAYLSESRQSIANRSPMGHAWVFGGGYADSLGDTIVATTPLFGWRGPLVVRDAVKLELNQYVVVAERSLLIAYEAAVAAVTVG